LVSSSQQRTSAAPVDGQSHFTPTTAVNGRSRARGAKSSAKRVDSDEDDDDQPLVPKKRAARKPPKKKTRVQDSNADAAEQSEMDEDDKPLASARKSSARGKRKVKVESEDDDDAPLVKKKPAAASKARGKTVKKDEGSDAEVPKPKKKGSKPKKEDDGGEETPKKGKRAKKEDEEDEEIHRWWDNENPAGDGTQKWQTLQHNGVYFPPPYEPLPSHVKMKYDGISFLLSPLICRSLSVAHRQACQPA
jgi:DNA topoisomerase-1